MPPRNNVSARRVRRASSNADAVSTLDALSFAASTPRRVRLVDAFAAALFGAAFACCGLGVSDARAQFFSSDRAPAQRYATRSGSSPAQTESRRNDAAPKTPLFSGKFARGVSEKISRDAAPQTASSARRPAPRSTREAATPQRGYVPPTSRPAPVPHQAPSNAYARSRTAAPTPAASPEELTQASTSRDAAREALAKIPWNALSPAAREKLAALSKNPTIYRRLPMAGGYCNPELFDFFLTHPHAVVGLWRQMGYNDVSMERIGPALYSIREKTGTVGRAQILYQNNELTLVYCYGKYQGPVVPRSLDGEMFLVLQTRYTEDPSGRPIAICRLDAFVDLKNPGADLLARTFSGALGKLADSNFQQTLAFIDSVSQTAETRPGNLSASIAGLSELSPEARRLFAAKTSTVARQAQLRANGTYVDYRLLPKLNSPSESVARVLSRERAGGAAVASVARSSSNAAPRGTDAFVPTPRDNSLTRESTAFNDFDKPSLAKNSFALSNDESDDDFDFESELDWDDEPLEVGGARVSTPPSASTVAPPTLVPETSVAKATARPATKFSDALALVESNGNDDETETYAEFEPLATDDETETYAELEPLATDGEMETGLTLLLDFENELLEETGGLDDETLAPPALAQPLSAAETVASPIDAADALPADSPTNELANADAADGSDASLVLPALVFDVETPDAETATSEEKTPDALPILLLPGAQTADATAPSTPPSKPTPSVSKPATPPRVALKPAAPKIAPPDAPASAEKASSTPPVAVERAEAPVWRAVVPPSSSAAKSQTRAAAKPVAKTASATDCKGATFRKPDVR